MVEIPLMELVLQYYMVLPETGKFLLLVSFSLAAAKFVQFFSLKIVKRIINARNGNLSNIIYEELHAPIYLTVALVGIYLATAEVQFVDKTIFYLENTVFTLGVLIWAWALNRTGDRVFEHVKKSESSRFDYEFAPIFENLWTAVVLIATVFGIISGIWQIDLTPLLASAGIIGIVGGFAAKDAIANFFGGLALYFDNTYKLGDFVVLDSGEEGIVVDIGIRSTDLRTRDDVIITVPNAVLNSSRVMNQSAPDKKTRMRVPVGVSYDADIEKVEEALLEVAEEENSVLESPRPRVRFQEFGNNAIQYELFAWIPNPIEKVRARHKVGQKIIKKFREEQITIPFPQRTVHMAEKGRGDRESDDTDGGPATPPQ